MVLPVPDGVNRAQLAVFDDPTLQVIQVVSERVLLIDPYALLLGECAECNEQCQHGHISIVELLL